MQRATCLHANGNCTLESRSEWYMPRPSGFADWGTAHMQLQANRNLGAKAVFKLLTRISERVFPSYSLARAAKSRCKDLTVASDDRWRKKSDERFKHAWHGID